VKLDSAGADVVAIAEDTQDAQGVIASLGDRGVLFVRIEAPAASPAMKTPAHSQAFAH